MSFDLDFCADNQEQQDADQRRVWALAFIVPLGVILHERDQKKFVYTRHCASRLL